MLARTDGRRHDDMQVTETLSQGLKREFKVVFPADELLARLDEQIAEMKQKVRLNGFRPGKVPVAHLKKVYGRSVMADVVQNAVNEANRKIIEDNGLRLALEPQVNLPEDNAEVETVLAAKGDLAFTVAVETLPKIEAGSFEDLELVRPVSSVGEAEVDTAFDRLVAQARTYSPRTEPEAAQSGDKLTIDFTGTIGGEAFEGGAGTDIEIVLGSKQFLPGFEEQLVGALPGESRTVTATFPQDYTDDRLAGREAEFKVDIKTVSAPDALTLDDSFAQKYNLESIEQLRNALKTSIEAEHDRLSREKLKRRLLDALDARYAFDLPQGLVDQEFGNIWRQVEAEQKRTARSFADEGTTEEAARAEYRKIAERRVRLGLVLAEVGDKAGVKVEDQEVTRALVERARQFPGQEKAIWDFYRNNQQALAELRAPLFEEKVVDHILGLVKVTDVEVTREELAKPDPEDMTLAPQETAEPAVAEALPPPEA
jgi:trigger factor